MCDEFGGCAAAAAQDCGAHFPASKLDSGEFIGLHRVVGEFVFADDGHACVGFDD